MGPPYTHSFSPRDFCPLKKINSICKKGAHFSTSVLPWRFFVLFAIYTGFAQLQYTRSLLEGKPSFQGRILGAFFAALSGFSALKNRNHRGVAKISEAFLLQKRGPRRREKER